MASTTYRHKLNEKSNCSSRFDDNCPGLECMKNLHED
jgi:hypothetical protein